MNPNNQNSPRVAIKFLLSNSLAGSLIGKSDNQTIRQAATVGIIYTEYLLIMDCFFHNDRNWRHCN